MDVGEFLRKFRERYVYKVSGEETVTGAAISRIARAGVVRREELVEDLVKLEAGRTGDDPGRVRERVRRVIRFVLHYLRSAGLVYAREHSRKSYIISTPWLLFIENVMGNKWVNWLREKAPHISESELVELKSGLSCPKLRAVRWASLVRRSSASLGD
uniref:Uncharacterized protein n=1 Tax=Ignisphaera aggregans TaxID=334771 RepID=A0A7J3Z5Y8_9CREN